MTLQDVTKIITEKVGNDCGLNATVKFQIDDAAIFVDATQVPNVVTNDNRDADCTVKVSLDSIKDILNGDMNPMTAFMMGKIKVEGNMGIAMNINKIL